jgi:hypothetical protein
VPAVSAATRWEVISKIGNDPNNPNKHGTAVFGDTSIITPAPEPASFALLTKDDQNFNFETVQKSKIPEFNAHSSQWRLSRNDAVKTAVPCPSSCDAPSQRVKATPRRPADGPNPTVRRGRRGHRPSQRHHFDLKPIPKTGGDGKRFGAEINHVKERSAEPVSRSGRRLLYNNTMLRYVHKDF